jgi:hypothetical protein
MVPVEPVSLSIGAVALASLFSTCVDCFDYFQAARTFAKDFEILLVQLDVEKTRLLMWGDALGVLRAADVGRRPELGNTSKITLMERCLDSIHSLLSDAADLQSKYGVRSMSESSSRPRNGSGEVSSNSMDAFKASYRRFAARFAREQNRSDVLSRTRWAIHDKAKFEKLIALLKGFMDGLYNIAPVPEQSQNEMMRSDISCILDISKLRIVSYACQKMYPAWSDMASAIIAASEAGTVDRRNVEEWLRDTQEIGDGEVTGKQGGNERPGSLPSSIQKNPSMCYFMI